MLYQVVNESTEIIEEMEVPLSVFDGTWAILNLVFAIIVAVECLLMISISAAKNNQISHTDDHFADEEYNEDYRRKKTFRYISVPVAVVAILEFFITENVALPMVLYDRYTFIMGLFLVIQTVMMVLCFKKYTYKEF